VQEHEYEDEHGTSTVYLIYFRGQQKKMKTTLAVFSIHQQNVKVKNADGKNVDW
jgi:hypothetical protein